MLFDEVSKHKSLIGTVRDKLLIPSLVPLQRNIYS